MIDLALFDEIIERCGGSLAQLPALRAAARHAEHAVDNARHILQEADLHDDPTVQVFALGSVGRMESTDTSDLDLAVVFNSERTTSVRAETVRGEVVTALRRRFDVPEKTFRRAVDQEDLLHNVGGQRDSNDRLTYRALLLTESVALSKQEPCTQLRRAIFNVYADGVVTRGKSLTSLTNDLHRYWRTVCVDYRHKVEEQSKGWAMRSLKLRHSRKLWHLANITLQLWAVQREQAGARLDEVLFERLHWPPLAKIGRCLHEMSLGELAAPLFETHDRFLSSIGDPARRRELGGLRYEARKTSDTYMALRDNARAVDRACEAIVAALWTLERSHLIRFCLL